jgi:tetratricopeptide (TPR) repeat protein
MDRREEGIRLYFDRRYTEAATVLGAVVASSPQDGRALTFLGLAQVQGGQVDEGLGTLRRADELAPGSADVHYGLGLAYGYLKQLDASIEAFERAVRLDASHAYAHYHLGLAYYQRGRKDLAILHLQRFVELEPSAPEAPQVRVLLAELS